MKDLANTLRQYGELKGKDNNAAEQLLYGSTNPQVQGLNLERLKHQFTHKEPDAYYQFLDTPEGYAAGNARTGAITPVLDASGKQYIHSTSSPSLQGSIAKEKASGKTFGENTTSAQINLPNDVANADQLIQVTQDLINHPGREAATGLSSLNPLNKIPGTAANDFNIALKQLKGKQFLQAFTSLRGGGAISNVEGEKATDAMSRMNTASSEKEFLKASKDFMDVVKAGRDRMIQKASMGMPQYAPTNIPEAPPVGSRPPLPAGMIPGAGMPIPQNSPLPKGMPGGFRIIGVK